MGEDVLGNPVVEDALAVDHRVLLLVEGGGVVLEKLDKGAGLGTFEKDLGLAFIDAPTAIHWDIPVLEEIHRDGVPGNVAVLGMAEDGRLGRSTPIMRRTLFDRFA
jgi:hypothetical protein